MSRIIGSLLQGNSSGWSHPANPDQFEFQSRNEPVFSSQVTRVLSIGASANVLCCPFPGRFWSFLRLECWIGLYQHASPDQFLQSLGIPVK